MIFDWNFFGVRKLIVFHSTGSTFQVPEKEKSSIVHDQSHRGRCEPVTLLVRKLDEMLEPHRNAVGRGGVPHVAHGELSEVGCVRAELEKEPLPDLTSDGQAREALGQDPGGERREVADVDHVHPGTFQKSAVKTATLCSS